MPGLEEFQPGVEAAELGLVFEAGRVGDLLVDEPLRRGELGIGLLRFLCR
jgi:hypothetical protein